MARSCTECGSALGGPPPPNLASSFVVLSDDLLISSPRGMPNAPSFSRGNSFGLSAALAQQKAFIRLCAAPSAPEAPMCAGCFEKLSCAIETELQHLEDRSAAYELALRQIQTQSKNKNRVGSSGEAPADVSSAVEAASQHSAGLHSADANEQEQLQEGAELEQQWVELEQQASAARRELSQLDLDSAHLAQHELAMAAAEEEHAVAELHFEARAAIDRDSLRARLAACDSAASSNSVRVEPMAALFEVHLGSTNADFEHVDGSKSSNSSSNSSSTSRSISDSSGSTSSNRNNNGMCSAVLVNGSPLVRIRNSHESHGDRDAEKSSILSAGDTYRESNVSCDEGNAVNAWYEVCTLVACARSAVGLPLWPLPFGPHAPCKSRDREIDHEVNDLLAPSRKGSLSTPSSKDATPHGGTCSDDRSNGGNTTKDGCATNEAADAAVLAVAVAVAATHDELRELSHKATDGMNHSGRAAAEAELPTRISDQGTATTALTPSPASLPFVKLLREAALAPVPLSAEQWSGLRWALGEALVTLIALVDSAVVMFPEMPNS